MAKPWIHALSSARRFGGKPEDYLDIHEFIDFSKGTVADVRHRVIFHTSFAISFILPKVFGDVRTNSDSKVYSVRDVGEQHVLEDYGGHFIPTVQDFLQEMEIKDWMQNGQGTPPSFAKIAEKRKKKFVLVD